MTGRALGRPSCPTRRRTPSGSALWVLGVISACEPARPWGTAQPAGPPSAVAAVASPGAAPAPGAEVAWSSDDLLSRDTPGLSYRFAVEACSAPAAEASCPFRLELRQGGLVTATLALDRTFAGALTPSSPAAVPGLGDPLGKPTGWRTWRIGKGADSEVVGAKVVRLGPRREAVLTRRVRFETARDSLFVRRDGALREVPIPGRWSSIAAQAKGLDSDQLTLFIQSPGQPGFVWATSPSWNEQTESLDGSASDPSIQLVVLGLYPGLEEALAVPSASAAPGAAAPCLTGGVVVPTGPYDGLPPGKFAYATVTSDRAAAVALLAGARTCAHAAGGSVLPLRFRWQPVSDFSIGGGKRAQLGLGPYDGAGWPLSIALAGAGTATERLALPWPTTTPVTTPPSPDSPLPAGDPAAPWTAHDKDVSAWAVGDSQAPTVVAIKPVRLGADRTGLLVAMEGGFEHRKRWHGVIMAGPDRLKIAWSATNPQGPAWSTVVVRPRRDGTQELLYLSVFEASQEGQADRLQVSRVEWKGHNPDPSIVDLACREGISLVVTRAFPTIDAAIAAKAEPCASIDQASGQVSDPASKPSLAAERLLILEAPSGTSSKGYVLAYATANGAAARRLASQAGRCWPKAHPTVRPWCQRQEKGG